MSQLEVGRKMQQIRGQYSYVFKITDWVCLQTTTDYSPFGVSLDGRTIAYQPAPAPTPSVGVIYLHKFDDGATTHPYTTAADQIDPNLSNGVWTNNTNSWYNYTGYTGKAIAINRADYDTARLYLNFTVASGKNMDVKSFSFYHRSSSTGYSNYKLYVNNILVGSGTIYVTSNSNLQFTGTQNVLNAISGLTGNVTVRLDLFGGAHGAAATFRLDNFTLNGYTQLISSPNLLAKGYRYGYQGSEMDNEVKGNGNSYTTYFRQLDPRVGRWFSIDPVFQPWQSPYCSMDGNPIMLNDLKGNKPKPKEAALIAKHVYGGMKDSKLKGGWKPSGSISSKTDYIEGDENGLKGRLYERTKKGVTEYVYAYAGTEDLLVDGVTDLTQIVGFSKQYDKAYGIAKDLSIVLGSQELTFVGHSLGGGLANYSALATDNASVTFNPAWISLASLCKKNLQNKSDEKLTNYVVFGEILDASQRAIYFNSITPIIKPRGKTNYLFSSKTIFSGTLSPWYQLYQSGKAHTIDEVINQIEDVDSYNKVWNMTKNQFVVDNK